MSVELPQVMTAAIPLWFSVAAAELGVHEIPGVAANPRVLEYLRTCPNLPASMRASDETANCSAFVNWCLMRAGIHGTNSASARSWLNWGVKLDEPKLGCVVVLSYDVAGPKAGHVGMFTRFQSAKALHLLGANQGDRVCGRDYDVARVLGYRWPT